jgi:hypothetical protein
LKIRKTASGAFSGTSAALKSDRFEQYRSTMEFGDSGSTRHFSELHAPVGSASASPRHPPVLRPTLEAFS